MFVSVRDYLHRYWVQFESCSDEPPTSLRLGCGVTAVDRHDAEALLREQVFEGGRLPTIIEFIDDVDVQTLDSGHVRPSMGDPSTRGVWFPPR